MKPNVRLAVVLVLMAIGAFLAFSLLLQHHGEELGTSTVSRLCGGGEDAGCTSVNQSAYAELAGVPWAASGLVFFVSMMALMALALVGDDDVRSTAGATAFALFALGLTVDLFLFSVQAFRIHAYCKLCLATYVLNAVSLALLWRHRRGLPAALRGVRTPRVRLAATGWTLVIVTAALGAAALETALDAREAYRAATILGSPLGPGSGTVSTPVTTPVTPVEPSPATSSGAKGELQVAQDEIKRLRETLDDPQKYAQYQVERSLKEFSKSAVAPIDLKTPPSVGPAEAPIKIAEYSDFLCPFCRNIAMAFHNYLPNTANRVSLHYKFYPLDVCNPDYEKQPMHPGACWLAFGGACAQEQGKFWPYHDRVFTMEPPKTAPDRAFVVRLGVELGLDAGAFDKCIDSARTRDRVVADIKEGTKYGVKGTPTLFINKRRLPDLNAVAQAIDEESKHLGLGPMPSEPAAGHGR
jgi:protein-disulfide isomerase/uncharacterized membrane protein